MMTKEVIHRFLGDAAELGVKGISFVSDGESTCSPHLTDSILYGRSLGLDMALGTNGRLLTRDQLEQILPALKYLRINMSAATPETYKVIHGCSEDDFFETWLNIKNAVRIKKHSKLNVTIGIQMVLVPEFHDQIVPVAHLGKDLGVDYCVIKHCSDDEKGTLGIDYGKYFHFEGELHAAERYSTPEYLVQAKWSKIMSNGERSYSRCHGPNFIMQFSGSGLVAPCGMLFNDRFKKDYHIGNLAETSLKQLFHSARYWEVLDRIRSDEFDAKTMCGSLCLQHKCNEFLSDWGESGDLPEPEGPEPEHVNFV